MNCKHSLGLAMMALYLCVMSSRLSDDAFSSIMLLLFPLAPPSLTSQSPSSFFFMTMGVRL